MGTVFGKKHKRVQVSALPTAKATEAKDSRRRNSLAYNISKFMKHEDEDFTPLIEQIKAERNALLENIQHNPRDEKLAKIADIIAHGNMRELRNQVISHYKTVPRKYKEHWLGNTLLHIICQEGYAPMLSFLLDPKNHSEFDEIQLDIDLLNDRGRTPLFLLFTPPTGTFLGLTYGLDENCQPKSVRPEGIEVLSDWIRTGGPKQREEMVDLLIARGANVKKKDFHGYTVLHYACMWGWTPICVALLEAGADINDTIITGRTPLMLAVEFENDLTVKFLLGKSTIHVNATDADGNTALILSAELGEYGNKISKMLLQKGADPNVENRKKRNPLYIACSNQNMELVMALLDHNVIRDGTSFALLSEENSFLLHKRIMEEERKAQIEAEKLESEEKKKSLEDGAVDMEMNGYKKKSPWGQWVQYNDKRGRGIFYYNLVSRQSQWDEPKDFQKVLGKEIKTATYGMNFYH